MVVMQTILEKLQEKLNDSYHSGAYDLKGTRRRNVMKLIVPSSSAALVIGKGGYSIKEIREANMDVTVQVYPKAGSEDAKTMNERILTIGAESNLTLLDVIQRILEKVASDPLHAALMELRTKNVTF